MKLKNVLNLLNIKQNQDVDVLLFNTKTGERLEIHSIDLDLTDTVDINFTEASTIHEKLEELKNKLEWLSTHNKNYTKQQYYIINDCLELIKTIGE